MRDVWSRKRWILLRLSSLHSPPEHSWSTRPSVLVCIFLLHAFIYVVARGPPLQLVSHHLNAEAARLPSRQYIYIYYSSHPHSAHITGAGERMTVLLGRLECRRLRSWGDSGQCPESWGLCMAQLSRALDNRTSIRAGQGNFSENAR